ncbi:permease [Candidatus Epulonipiscium fishelsonii]|nr:permease [Epulopiscium sp. SCG-C06WGA-EpuloA1]
MNEDKKIIPFFKRTDIDAAAGQFFDGFSKVIVTISILLGTFGLSSDLVFGNVLPGIVAGIVLLNGGLWLYYRGVAKKRNDPDLVAIPGGLQAGRIFIWLFSIALPIFSATGDGMLALEVGIFGNFLGGIIFIIGAYTVPMLLKIVPSAALFGTVAGAAMCFLILESLNGIFTLPIVGWAALILLLILYLAKIETKLPAAFIAIAFGSVIAWITGAMEFGNVTAAFSSLGFNIPLPTFGFFSSEVINATIPYLPIIIVFSIGEVISSMQAVGQAHECGDTHFESVKPIVIAGVASILSSFLGNPLALGLYWGYPAWKEIKAGTGYHLGTVALYAAVGLTGLTAIINAFIPEAATLPVLVFIGICSFAQVFESSDKKYYPAAIIAMTPLLMEWAAGKASPGVALGFDNFRVGSTFIGMIFGAIVVAIIDRKWINATYASIAGLILIAVGMAHSPGVIFTEAYAPSMDFVALYGLTAVGFAILHFMKFKQDNIN